MADKIVILGAGPAGLACAHKILEKGGMDVILIDKASDVGGLSGSFNWNGYSLDFGPHTFHARGGEPEALIRNLYTEDPHRLIAGKKKVMVYLKGKFYKYPLRFGEVLKKFNALLSLRIMIEFVFAFIVHKLVAIPIEDFETWGVKKFGRKLYQLGFGDYTEKVWKTKVSNISIKFASEKIQGFSFLSPVRRILRSGGEVTEPYFQSWLYPVRGSADIYNKMAYKIKEMGGSIILDARISSIKHCNNRVESIEYFQNEELFSIKPDHTVSTIHMGALMKLLSPNPPFFVSHSFQKLKYISLIIVYLEFDIDSVTEWHWFYLLDKGFRFNRVAEQKNLAKQNDIRKRTVLSLELSCKRGDAFWCMSDEELIKLAQEDIASLSIIDISLICNAFVKRIPETYEIYYKGFEKHADISLSYIRLIERLSPIGRKGLFLQGDQHQSVEMGLKMGDILTQGKVTDDAINEFYRNYVRYIDEFD